MKVVLLEDVGKIGTIGKVVEVKDGFARNYLLPQGKARIVTEANLKLVKKLLEERHAEAEQRLKDAQGLAERLGQVSVTIPVRVTEEEKMYGSITAREISEMLGEQGYEIDYHNILLPESIKELGVYDVKVRLHPEVVAQFKVWVVKE